MNNADFTPTMLPFNPTGSFKFWCQKVLPLVYDDSLSYYEVLAKIVSYLNSVIENVDNLDTNVNNIFNSYEELQNYVNNFFDNLDVQDEINNKLDEMYENGDLLTLIEAYMPAKVYTNVSSMVSDTLLKNGVVCVTLGYYNANDGGSSYYIVRNSEPTGFSINLENGKYAELIVGDSLNYRMFGAKLNGSYDDSSAITTCHTVANNAKIPVIQNNGTIYIKTGTAISVKTDTDLNGCTFLLNDDMSHKGVDEYFYVIDSDIDTALPQGDIARYQLSKGSTYIPFLDAYPNRFIVLSCNKLLGKRAYVEDGVTKYAPWNMAEVITTGQGGYLIDGCLLYDYTDASQISMHVYSSIDSPVTFKCPKLTINRSDSTSMPSLVKVLRSNVTITGLTINNISLGSSSYKDFVGRVIYVNSFNCIVEKCTGVNPTEKYVGNMTLRSGYCIQFEYASTGTVRDCVLTDNWGVINTQCVKNMNFRDSILNRIDNHWTMNNFNIDNVTIVTTAEGIVLGHGDGVVNINNVKYICDKMYHDRTTDGAIVKTRADLGGTYEGTVNISNITAEISGLTGDRGTTIFRHYSAITATSEFYKSEDISNDVNITNVTLINTDGGTFSVVICYQFYADGVPTSVKFGNVKVTNIKLNGNTNLIFSKGSTNVPVRGGYLMADLFTIPVTFPELTEERTFVEIDTAGVTTNFVKNAVRQITSFAWSFFDRTLKHNTTYSLEVSSSTAGNVTISNNRMVWTGCVGGTLIFSAFDFTSFNRIVMTFTLTGKTSEVEPTNSLYTSLKKSNSWSSQTLKAGDNYENMSGNKVSIIDVSDINETGYLCFFSWNQQISIESIKVY